MPRHMTATQYLAEIELAKENAIYWDRIHAVVAYIACGVAACICLFYYADTIVK